MKLFTFVPTLALPSGAPRSAWVCGARALRPCAPPRTAPVVWAPMCVSAETPVAPEDPATKIPDVVPEPAAEAIEVVETPAVEKVSAPPAPEIVAEETPVVEETPVAEESVSAEEIAVAEEASVVEESISAEKIPVAEEAPVAEESASAEEIPVAEEAPVMEEPAPVVGDTPAEVTTAEDAAEVVGTVLKESAVTKEPDEKTDDRKDKRKRRRRQQREVTLPFEKMTIGMELEGTVKSVMSYGAFVGDMGTPTDGLLHVSQLAAGFVENVTDVVQVGMKVKVRVIDMDKEKGNFSLSMKPVPVPGEETSGGSRRSGRAEARKASEAKWNDFQFDPKVFVDARVTTIADFGAFCQLLNEEGNVLDSVPTDGLVHISELSEERVNSVTDVLKVGQTVKVRISSVDKKRNRISLSMKAWAPDETNTFAEDMAAHTSSQPVFKTSFELAFERARRKE